MNRINLFIVLLIILLAFSPSVVIQNKTVQNREYMAPITYDDEDDDVFLDGEDVAGDYEGNDPDYVYDDLDITATSVEEELEYRLYFDVDDVYYHITDNEVEQAVAVPDTFTNRGIALYIFGALVVFVGMGILLKVYKQKKNQEL